MNKVVTSKEQIVEACRKISSQKGIKALNIRQIAQECKVSVGSVYNYFPSKSDLVVAIVEDVWKSVFHNIEANKPQAGFIGCVRWLFDSMQAGSDEYPSFFTMHSMSFSEESKGAGRAVMHSYFEHIKDGLIVALEDDKAINQKAFSDDLTAVDFADFVFLNVVSLLARNQRSCDFLIEIIKRTIY